MSLENLLKIGSLHRQDPDRDALQRLLQAAEASLRDASVHGLEPESRFDLAYKAAMRAAMAALWANGYRTSTSTPGHHQTAIQTLGLTIGYPRARVLVLDALRKKRNGIDYDADIVSAEMVATCTNEARDLLAAVRQWIIANRPELAARTP